MKGLRRYALAAWFAYAAWRSQRHLNLHVAWTARSAAARDRLFPSSRTDRDG